MEKGQTFKAQPLYCYINQTIQTQKDKHEQKPFYSFKQILQDHWADYERTHDARPIEKEEVEKALSCKGEERGCFLHYCPPCNLPIVVPLGCNSRLCSCCGKRHTDRWAATFEARAFKGIVHRHFVFTLPDTLWEYVKRNRKLQKVIMDSSSETIEKLYSKMKRQKLIPAVMVALHPYAKDIGFKPHSHCIATQGGFNEKNKYVDAGYYLPYNLLHRLWQYIILEALRGFVPDSIIDWMYRKYPNGFYAFVKEEKLYVNKGMGGYIARYLRHPAIANSRIVAYNKEAVKFYYEDDEKKKHYKIMLAHEFISAVIQHLPEKYDRLVRYYGAYHPKKIRRYRIIIEIELKIKQSIIVKAKSGDHGGKNVVYCPQCFRKTVFLGYMRKPPPKDMSRISEWLC